MKLIGIVAAIALTATVAAAQGGIERLYVLDCGVNQAKDQSRWSPGVNEGKPIEFSDNCYLIRHAKGLLPGSGPTATSSRSPCRAGQRPARVWARKPNNTALMIDSDMPPRIDATFDLRETTDLGATFPSGGKARFIFARKLGARNGLPRVATGGAAVVTH
jgi:hypothetical protein